MRIRIPIKTANNVEIVFAINTPSTTTVNLPFEQGKIVHKNSLPFKISWTDTINTTNTLTQKQNGYYEIEYYLNNYKNNLFTINLFNFFACGCLFCFLIFPKM